MTVIAFRDGVLAADSMAQSGAKTRQGAAPKIFDLGAGRRGAICGYAPLAYELVRWFKRGAKAKDQPSGIDSDHEANLVVFDDADGTIEIYERGSHQPEGVGPFHAYGYGAEIAMGAMWMGATAQEAVQAAIDLCTECGGPIQVLKRNAE